MRKDSTTLFLFFLIALCCFSQEKTPEELPENAISDHLLENVHLHLNKTTFARGEQLWFMAYVQDQMNQIPSLKTSNLNVGIYNRTGKEIKRKMLHVEDGIATGYFSIDSTFTANYYLVLAWTNYMQNFEQLKPFQQQIKVLDNFQIETSENENKLTIEIYPEGGNIISNAFNNLGIRCIDANGRGIAISNIQLVDEENNILSSNIATNSKGFGKVGFVAEKQKEYNLSIKLPNGGLQEVPLPRSGASVVGLSIDNLGLNQVVVKMVISEELLRRKADATYSLAIFQNNDIILQDWQIKSDERAIAVQRNLLPYGINTAVLFDELRRPVSWRMFFNHRKDEKRIVEMAVKHMINTTRDSVEIRFDLPENVLPPMTMSVSVLPEGTQAYMPEQSLASSFLIGPYLNNAVGGKYYMEDFDRQKNYALDMKLLVEGWGRYDWDSRLKENDKIDFDMESGIKVNGKILDADLTMENQAYLMADDSKAMAYVNLQSDKSFETKMILFENDSLNVSLIGKNGILRKPKMDLQIGKAGEEGGYDIPAIFKELGDSANEFSIGNDTERTPLTLDTRTIVLDEVVVQDKVIRDNKLKLTSAQIEGRLITDNEIEKYVSVANYLRKRGYRVRIVDGRMMVLSKLVSPKGHRTLVFIGVNGMLAQRGEVANMPLSIVQSIIFGNNALGFSAGAVNFIGITTRDNHYVSPEYRNKFIKTLIAKGYARPGQYFNPGYDYSNYGFQKYGVIDWHSKVILDGTSPASIIVPILNQDAIHIFAEGMGVDGSLIAIEKVISLKETLQE